MGGKDYVFEMICLEISTNIVRPKIIQNYSISNTVLSG